MAFSTSDVHAVARGPFELLSAEHLYYHAVKRVPNGHPADGISLPAVLQALELDGQSVEEGWPYLDALPQDLATWQPPPTAAPVFRHFSSIHRGAIARVVNCLDAGRPVVVVVLISERFFIPINGLVFAGTPDADVDYHAVIAVGYGSDGTKQFVMVRNSWGRDWGLQGHAWIAEDYLDARIAGIAVMKAPIMRRTTT